MTARRKVLVRVDTDVVEVRGRRWGRRAEEQHPVGPGGTSADVLERTLRRSRLLAPGRRCELGVLLESPMIRYRDVRPGPDAPAAGTIPPVELPEAVREVLEPLIARRRVHGPAWFAPGPAHRAIATIRARAAAGAIGRGVIVDRSSAAVTVLVVDSVRVAWARGGPGDAPAAVASLLLERAAETVEPHRRLEWWHLEDVARPGDGRERRRVASEVEARCHDLLGGLPRITVPA